MDAKSLCAKHNETHFFMKIFHYENCSAIYNYNASGYFSGGIFLDTDLNSSTGGIWGAEYWVGYYVTPSFISGEPGPADGILRRSLGGALWEDTGVEPTLIYSPEGPEIIIAFVDIDSPVSMVLHVETLNVARDWFDHIFTYTTGQSDNITVDGDPADWSSVPSSYSDYSEGYIPAEFDFTDFYITDNSTMLYHRFDVTGIPTKTMNGTINNRDNGHLRRHIVTYYDTDQNSSTGFRYAPWGRPIGVDIWLSSHNDIQPGTNKTSFLGRFHKYNSTSQSWEQISPVSERGSASYDSIFEWGVPLSNMGVEVGTSIDVLVQYADAHFEDQMPDLERVSYSRSPSANFTYSLTSPIVNQILTFNGSLSTPNGGNLVDFVWSFGDGFQSEGMTVEHSYAQVGTYNVTLTVIDSEGMKDTIWVTITVLTHDLELASVTVNNMKIYLGQSVNVTAVLQNTGNFSETSEVTAYANNTIIGMQTVTDLPFGASMMLSFYWNATVLGRHEISVNIAPVPSEIDTADNTFVDGWIFVTSLGDIDEDRDVDIYDIVHIARVYGAIKSEPSYDANVDIDSDGDIDFDDIMIAAGNYGESW